MITYIFNNYVRNNHYVIKHPSLTTLCFRRYSDAYRNKMTFFNFSLRKLREHYVVFGYLVGFFFFNLGEGTRIPLLDCLLWDKCALKIETLQIFSKVCERGWDEKNRATCYLQAFFLNISNFALLLNLAALTRLRAGKYR